MKCCKCKTTKRIKQMFVEGKYIDICPKCALKLRNKIHGLSEGTPFHGEMANELYQQQIEEDFYKDEY